MRNRRRRWFIRRMVLGFAIVAVAAPVAQARIDEGTSSKSSPVASSHNGFADRDAGTNPAIVTKHTGFADRVVGSNPAIVTKHTGFADRVVGSNPATVVGYRGGSADRIGVPTVGSDYNQFAYRRALPSDIGQYNQFAYRRALPSDVGSQPILVSSKADGINWSDAGIGAGLAFALVLLAAGATMGTRHLGRTASA